MCTLQRIHRKQKLPIFCTLNTIHIHAILIHKGVTSLKFIKRDLTEVVIAMKQERLRLELLENLQGLMGFT